MTDPPNPPLFDALWTLSGLTARHQLREEPAMSEHHLPAGWSWEPAADHDGRRYGDDDIPGGPLAPPLGDESHAVVGTSEVLPLELVPCPCCGTGVTPDRLTR